jgi:hypothetical protein
MQRTREYEIYHARVVEACAELMGEDSREFYDRECTYFEEFEQNIPPFQVAQDQLAAMRELVAEADARRPEEPLAAPLVEVEHPERHAPKSRRRVRVI